MLTTEYVNDKNHAVYCDGEKIGHITQHDGGWFFTAASKTLAKVWLENSNPAATWERAVPVDIRNVPNA